MAFDHLTFWVGNAKQVSHTHTLTPSISPHPPFYPGCIMVLHSGRVPAAGVPGSRDGGEGGGLTRNTTE